MGDGPPWDESTRPTRDRTRDRPATPHGQAQARHLVEIHDHLRLELTRVRELIAQVRGGTLGADRARAAVNGLTMRRHGWSLGAYCASYCRVVTQHHTIEDRALFPYLRGRDAAVGRLSDALLSHLAYEERELLEPIAQHEVFA